MVMVKNVAACKKTALGERKEVFLCESFTVTAAKHVTLDIDRIACRQERKNIPAQIQLVVEFCGVSYDLVHLRLHKVRIAGLVHIAHIVKVKERQVESLWPRLKLRLCNILQPGILSKPFERLELKHAKRTQLIFEHRVVRISRVRRSRCATFGLVIRIAKGRTFQECLREEFSKLRFTGLVILMVANAKAQVLFIRFIALRFRTVT